MSRGVGAVLVAAVMVLSGCASATEDVTTTSPSPETPVNPWDLPLEERPDLFDPCAEIPVEAIEEGVGSSVESDSQFRINKPGELLSCGWRNQEVIFNVLSTWKSREEFLNDRAFVSSKHFIADRPGLRLLDSSGTNSCRQVFFTSSGAVFSSVDLVHGLTAFQGENFADPCEVLNKSIVPIMRSLPAGDY